MPKISIIVPVYNTEKYLRPCLDSILAQTFGDFEAILVDDGSKDQSGAICDEYAARDPRFIVIHKQNEGVSKARITAFEQSKGELITFIDSDDYVSPEYLEKLSKPILEDDADMVSCDYDYVENGKIRIPTARLNGTWKGAQIKDFIANHYFFDDITQDYGMTIFLCTKMIKRQFVFEGLRQGDGMWYAEDQIAVFQILMNCEKMVLLPDRLYYYVQHEGQAMKKYDYSLWENLILLMERYKSLDIDNIAEISRKKRTWWHINNTIMIKMRNAKLSRRDFCSHLSRVRNHPYIDELFSNYEPEKRINARIKFWLLKHKMYNSLYYLIALRS